MRTPADGRPAPIPPDPWGPRLVDGLTRLVFVSMGTVVSLQVPAGLYPAQRDRVQEVFAERDARFSLYREQSEAREVHAGRLDPTRASGTFRTAFAEAQEWYGRTGGVFTPYQPSGRIDLMGIVKAQAMRDAGAILDGWGLSSWCLNAGGDVLVRDDPAGDSWVAGIVDPQDRGRMLAKMLLAGNPYRALATSGTAERAEHIWRLPGVDDLVQVSVLADDIVVADVLATAVMAGGAGCVSRFAADQDARGHPVEILSVSRDHQMTGTPGVAGLSSHTG